VNAILEEMAAMVGMIQHRVVETPDEVDSTVLHIENRCRDYRHALRSQTAAPVEPRANAP
jgi:hypothetical protein